MNRTIQKVHHFRGKPLIPGDKSISHRGMIFGAMAYGTTEVISPLESGDVHSTINCLKNLGVSFTQEKNRIYIEGVGDKGFTKPTRTLDCGNSGTTMRLMMGVLSGCGIEATLTGDSSLVKRPMRRVAEPLELMGSEFELTNNNFAPLSLKKATLSAVKYELKIASAQIKTAIILAALYAKGTTEITGKIYSRDHTERLLRHFGVTLEEGPGFLKIRGGQKLIATTVHVPGDPSTAAFWMAAACLIPGANIELENISLNPTRVGFINVLQRMGADIVSEITSQNPEPVGRIFIKSKVLTGVTVSSEEIPSLIDEVPLIAVLGSQASGLTIVQGAEELRVKESDRLESIAIGLRAMGVEIEIKKDGFQIHGPQKLRGATIESFHDHRIAMAFSIAGLVADGDTHIRDANCVEISYPEFYETLEDLTRP